MTARKRSIQVFLAVAIVLLAVNAVLSLRWRFQHDPPILLYITWLMDRFGYVPYRDIFDVNLPGTYALYLLIGKVSGYTDLGVRCVDLGILAVELLLTWVWMRKLGVTVALCGAVLWGLCYLQLGSQVSIQREYLILLPLLAGIVLGDRFGETAPSWSAFGVGFFFAIAALMKPHAAVGLPFVLYLGQKPGPVRAMIVRLALPAAAGFCLPIAGSAFYLWWNGGLSAFLDMAQNYWPLYAHLSGEHQSLAGVERVSYLIGGFRRFGGLGLWLVPATLGAYLSLYRAGWTADQKRRVFLLIVLACCYCVYPVLTGQFWIYHWLLFLYFTVQVASLCLVDTLPGMSTGERILPVIVLALFALSQAQYPGTLERQGTAPVKGGRVDAIAAFLRTNMRPGDTVQPLDWTGGAVHAMLLSQARIATPFVYDFHFYHHISNGYIRQLRRRFIAALGEARPRFIVQVVANDKPWVWGDDTTTEFKELALLLASSYAPDSTGSGFVIYELRNDPGSR